MQLPTRLQLAIDELINGCELKPLIGAREELTQKYRSFSQPRQFMTNDKQREAYIISRLPATYAAIHSCLSQIKERNFQLPIKSILDLGAGPGTAMWAALDFFPEVEQIHLMEKDRSLADLGKHLAQYSEHSAIRSSHWETVDLEETQALPPHDLIILSYSIGELEPQHMMRLLKLCWQATQQLLVIIEPGTPVGFERIRTIRRQLIDEQAHIIAPCPHHLTCPMIEGEGDWCHFAARVERSTLHRKLKGGSLGHEDEKFSYIAVTKTPFDLPDSRILRHPNRHSGHVTFKLCTKEGLKEPTISKKMGPIYKQARKAEWGDSFPYI